MGQDSKIEWTHHTFNPWWGCAKVSPGCANCYAEAFARRVGNDVWGESAPRRFFGDAHWHEPVKWDAAAAAAGLRKRVFCASMADVFEDRADLVESRARLFRLVSRTPNLDWLLLTKRPQNIRRLSPDGWTDNVWLGTTAENQSAWDERLPLLAACSARVKFVSVEPMLGPIDMGRHWPDWVICGGESGGRARPVSPDLVRSLRDQCVARQVDFFFKQWGGRDKKAAGRVLDEVIWNEVPQ